MAGEEASKCMPVFMEQYSLGMCSCWVHCTQLGNGSYQCRHQGLQAFGGGLKSCKLTMRVQNLSMNKYGVVI